MFFLSFCLILLSLSAINATLPDINSFMPNILAMVPFNGRIKINDQVFAFGDPNASLESNPQLVSQETPAVAPEEFGSRTVDSLPVVPNLIPQSIINSPSEQSTLQNGATFVSQIPNFETRDPNFNTRIPNFETSNPNFEVRFPNTGNGNSPFESRNPGFDSSNPNFNAFPNSGSTEIGSTFAGNAKSDVSDEFTASTPIPFGLPINTNEFAAPTDRVNFRSNQNPMESPLFVMPLVVSPDRLLQTESLIPTTTPVPSAVPTDLSNTVSTTPTLPILGLFPSASDKSEKTNFTLFSDPNTTQKNESTGSKDQRIDVTRQTSFIFPQPMVSQTRSETVSQLSDLSSLEQHFPSVHSPQLNFGSINTKMQTSNKDTKKSVIPFPYDTSIFRPQKIPTFAEIDKQLKELERERQTSRAEPTVLSMQTK